MFDINEKREDFPIFKQNPKVIYFDNASTTQKPLSVIDSIKDFYLNCCSNIGRGSYSWAGSNYLSVKRVREKVASFINANDTSEVVFTTGSTHSSNIIASSWGIDNLKTGDEVMLCFSDHKSTVMPWVSLKKTLEKMGIFINLIPILIHPDGDYDETDLHSKVNDNTKIIVLTHIHNVYGMEMAIDNIVSKLKENNRKCLISLDASQSISHLEIDVKQLKIDFLYFSGHKMFSANGVGVLWVRKDIHSDLNVFMSGGNIKEDRFEDTERNGKTYLYERMETGTQNIASIISLAKAIDYINSIGIKNIEQHLYDLSIYLMEGLREIKNIEFLPGPGKCRCAVGYGIISFKIKNISSSDVGFILNENEIFVRTGAYCTLDRKQDDSVRVSFQIYNTKEEVDKFIDVISEIAEGI